MNVLPEILNHGFASYIRIKLVYVGSNIHIQE